MMGSKHFIILLLFSCLASTGHSRFCSEVFAKKTVIESYLDLFGKEKSLVPQKPTSGVEVEAMIPKDVGMLKVAEATYEYLTELGYEVSKVFSWQKASTLRNLAVYSLIWKNSKGEEYTLKIMPDHSIYPEVGYRGVEIVSPILRNKRDAEEFFSAIEMLKELGLKQEVNRAGVHVHVGVPNITPKELGMIGWTFSLLEVKLRNMVDLSSFREKFVNKQPEAEVESFRSMKASQMSVKRFLKKFYPESKSRYVGVNMAALKKFGTIEIRLFNSSVDPRVIRFVKHLSRKVVLHTRNQTPEFIAFLKRAEVEDFSLFELFEVLGMDLVKSAEVMEIMTKEKTEQKISNFRMQLRQIRVLPQNFYEGFVEGKIIKGKAPAGWEELMTN